MLLCLLIVSYLSCDELLFELLLKPLCLGLIFKGLFKLLLILGGLLLESVDLVGDLYQLCP